MNFKDLLLPMSLALLTMWGVNYFLSKSSTEQNACEAKSGQGFVAPKTVQELKPLNTQITFNEREQQKPAQQTEIETNQARLVFSTHGASLETLEFKQIAQCPACPIQTIDNEVQENRCFLVALPDRTPFYYDLVDKQEDATAARLTYQASFDGGQITKQFTVHKNSFQVDLTIAIDARNGQELEPRIIWPSPVVKALGTEDVVSGIFSNEKGSIEKITRTNLVAGQGWFAPTLFGTDDRYFVHALVKDPQGFAKRAYYKSSDNQLVSIVEGMGSSAANSWTVSFYMGPKECAALTAVDSRLEETLEYSGFFSPLSKFLLYVLKLLYGYVKNFGFAIIALTILVKLILLPFTYGAEDSMKKRLEFDKKLRYLQQKYKDQPDILAQERAELIKKHGMPGLSGCLPLLLQLPIFIALSRVLSSAIELYHAPFIGWIHDLSAKDPYYVLPILTAIGMLLQSLLVPNGDPKQRISAVVMALLIGAFTANIAAGLSLYICTFTLLGVVQTQALQLLKRS